MARRHRVAPPAAAGLVAGGLSAALYATHCTDDSPLFVATWYTIAIAAVTVLGAILDGGCCAGERFPASAVRVGVRLLACQLASARVTASGSVCTIFRRMRALRSGRRRPCSQSRTADSAKP